MRLALRRFVLVSAMLVLAACGALPPAPPTATADMQAQRKINLDLSAIDENGMLGAGDSRRSVAYEFCVPNDSAKLAEVQGIDPSLQCYLGSPGRIRCTKEQYLCIGESGTRETLLRLASLDYIERIDPFYGE